MDIVRLSPEHAPDYRALMLEAYEAHPEAFTSTRAERATLPVSWWQERLSTRSGAKEKVYGALDAASLIGVAGVSFSSREKTSHKARVFGMYVRAASRGSRCGEALLDRVLSDCRATPGVSMVQLTVSAGNEAALALYRKAGFEVFGEEPCAIKVDNRFVTKLHMLVQLR